MSVDEQSFSNSIIIRQLAIIFDFPIKPVTSGSASEDGVRLTSFYLFLLVVIIECLILISGFDSTAYTFVIVFPFAISYYFILT